MDLAIVGFVLVLLLGCAVVSIMCFACGYCCRYRHEKVDKTNGTTYGDGTNHCTNHVTHQCEQGPSLAGNTSRIRPGISDTTTRFCFP
jgi:hypothetical protein